MENRVAIGQRDLDVVFSIRIHEDHVAIFFVLRDLVVERFTVVVIVRHPGAQHGLKHAKSSDAERQLLSAREAILEWVLSQRPKQLNIALYGRVGKRIQGIEGGTEFALAVEVHRYVACHVGSLVASHPFSLCRRNTRRQIALLKSLERVLING